MNVFARPPTHPYLSLWISLVAGCVVGSGLVCIISSANNAGGAGFFAWALYFSLMVGGGITLLLATPIVWLFVRIGCAGPGSVVLVLGGAFFIATRCLPKEAFLPGLIYVGNVGLFYLFAAFTRFVYR